MKAPLERAKSRASLKEEENRWPLPWRAAGNPDVTVVDAVGRIVVETGSPALTKLIVQMANNFFALQPSKRAAER